MTDIEKYKKTIAQLYNNLENEKKQRKEEQLLYKEEKRLGKEQEQKLIDMEVELREKNEKLEAAQFNITRLTKRVEVLMDQNSEQKNNKNEGGYFGAIFSGNKKEQIQILESQIKILQDELKIKIEENEHTHMSIFELKRDHTQKIQGIQASLNEYIELNSRHDKIIDAFKFKEERMIFDLQQLENAKKIMEKELNEKLDEMQQIKSSFDQEKKDSQDKLNEYQQILQKRITFLDDSNPLLNAFNSIFTSRDYFIKQQEWISRTIPVNNQLLIHFQDIIKSSQAKIKLVVSDIQNYQEGIFTMHNKYIVYINS